MTPTEYTHAGERLKRYRRKRRNRPAKREVRPRPVKGKGRRAKKTT